MAFFFYQTELISENWENILQISKMKVLVKIVDRWKLLHALWIYPYYIMILRELKRTAQM